MKWLIAIVLFAAAPVQPSPQHFKHVRDVTVNSSTAQNYIAADEALWRASEAALNDVRLYAGDLEVPYLRHEANRGESTQETPATVLNLSKVGDRAQFILAVPGNAGEYNRVTVQLTDGTKNFVSRVSVEGTDDDSFARWAKIGDYTLYDFSREDLGRNSTLRLPLLRYKYLFLKLYGMRPEQVQGANITRSVEQKEEWTELTPRDVKVDQRDGNTVITWTGDSNVPVDCVRVEVAGDANFYRQAVASYREATENGDERSTHGFIRRITMNRGGRAIREEDIEVAVNGSNANQYSLTIRNGDDRPLDIKRIVPLVRQSRFYFDAEGKSGLSLFVGDAALRPPQYDYARTATVSTDAARAELGSISDNPGYTPRPDARPWSERHPWVLWVALVVAVIVLGAIAIKSFATAPKQANS